MSGRTIDETGRDVPRLPNLLTIPDAVATMVGNGGRQDANSTQGQDGRAAAALPPSDTIGSRDFSCLVVGLRRVWAWVRRRRNLRHR